MYEAYWKLDRSPFTGEVHPESFYEGRSHQAAALKLRYLIETSQGAGLLAGQPGLGKSTVLRMLQQMMPADQVRFVPILFPQMDSTDFLSYFASKLGDRAEDHAPGRTVDQSLQIIERRLKEITASGQQTVLLVDDAQLIEDRKVLNALQGLLNYNERNVLNLTVIFAGQLELVSSLKRHRQLDERIAFKCLLVPLVESETAEYVRRRMVAAGAKQPIFTDSALQTLHRLSGGVPRRINRLCDFSLLVGYSDELPELHGEHLEAVAEEMLTASAA